MALPKGPASGKSHNFNKTEDRPLVHVSHIDVNGLNDDELPNIEFTIASPNVEEVLEDVEVDLEISLPLPNENNELSSVVEDKSYLDEGQKVIDLSVLSDNEDDLDKLLGLGDDDELEEASPVESVRAQSIQAQHIDEDGFPDIELDVSEPIDEEIILLEDTSIDQPEVSDGAERQAGLDEPESEEGLLAAWMLEIDSAGDEDLTPKIDNDKPLDDLIDNNIKFSEASENDDEDPAELSSDDSDSDSDDWDSLLKEFNQPQSSDHDEIPEPSSSDLDTNSETDSEEDDILNLIDSLSDDSLDDSDNVDESKDFNESFVFEEVDEDSEALPDLEIPLSLDDIEDADSEEDEEDEDEDGDFGFTEDDDFVPPANPFAAPPLIKKSKDADDDSDTESELEDDSYKSDSEEDGSSTIDSESSEKSPGMLSNVASKISGMLSASSIKGSMAHYWASIQAEMHGEDAPEKKGPSDTLEDGEVDDRDEEDNPKKSKSKRSGGFKSAFGFLSPIKKLYMFVVNIFFSILTGILGILSKFPLIGFVFRPILAATNILKSIAQYLPIVFIIGSLVAVSYFSIPRAHTIELPDSGGAVFSKFKYNSEKSLATGELTNTGDIIVEAIPEFKVVTIQPGINPKSWVIPQEVFSCKGKSVDVGIDEVEKVSVKCAGEVTGYSPRSTGTLKY